MPPRGWRRPVPRTAEDYTKALQILGGLDRIAGVLAQDFPDCPRVLLIVTMLGDAHRELSEKMDALIQAQKGAL